MKPSSSTQAGDASSGVHSGGSKDVRRAIGVSQGGLESRTTLAEWFSENVDLFGLATPESYQSDSFATLMGEAGFVFRNTPPAG